MTTTASVGLPRELLPTEYACETLGAYTRWTVRVGRLQPPTTSTTSALRYLRNALPNPESLKSDLSTLASRVPLLLRFALDLARDNGRHFWIVLIGKVIQSFIPAAELACYAALIQMAREAPSFGAIYDGRALALALGGRIGLLLLSTAIDHLSEHSENIVNARFQSSVQRAILQVHCRLDDDALVSPEVQRKLSLLRGLGDGSAYGSLFDPLAFVRVLNTGLSLTLEIGVLYLRVNRSNTWLLALSTGFMLLQNVEAGPSATTLEHIDTTSNSFLRLQNLYKLGTSSTLRREVNTLGLHDFILEESEAARASIGTATPFSSSPLDHPRQQLRRAGGTRRMWAWRPLLADLERPLTYTLYILMKPGSPLLAFADVATLENGNRQTYFRFLSLRGYVIELSRGLESMDAFYDVQELERAFQPALSKPYSSATSIGGGGNARKGMHIEFRDVTFRYAGASRPALHHVSFTILPGELIAIVGSNGSGKSSLITLLAGTERDYEGTILINQVDIKAYSRRDLAAASSFAFQHAPALPFSIREFVALGSLQNREDDTTVREALREAGADEVVARLPDDWNTYPSGSSGTDANAQDPWSSLEAAWEYPRISQRPLGPPSIKMGPGYDVDAAFSWLDDEDTKAGSSDDKDLASSSASLESGPGAVEDPTREYPIRIAGEPARLSFPLHSPAPRILSSGQWQRIALARSFMSKGSKDLLVFDEPGASLDPAAEASAFDSILSRRGQATVIFSTHRFGITSKADRILCFDAGHLAENGTHEELVAREGGQYRSFWDVQARGFETQA